MSSAYDKETAIAKRMQLALMPSAECLRTIEQQFALQTANCFLCSSELSGDFWGCKTLSDEELALYISDFSGHGLASAINTFRFHALLEHQLYQYGRDPAYFIALLNQQMTTLLTAEQFTTAFYGVLHTGLNTLFYIAAGTPPPLLLRPNGTIEWIDGTGLPLGIIEQTRYPLQEISFLRGDLLLCYSDSLIEQPLPDGTMLDENNIADIVLHTLSQHPNHLPNALLEALLSHFRTPSGEVIALADDLTINMYLRK
jgi:phosphoserine phosphatase RsbU/P